MKKIILISAVLIIAVSSNLFAKKGFGVDLKVPLGAEAGFFHNDANKKSDGGFEFGVYLQPNYYWEFSAISFGLSLELGYQRDIFAYKDDKSKGNISFDSFNLGFMPKIDILFLSVGLGGGVKFPLGGNSSSISSAGERKLSKYDYKDLKENYGNNLYIPYLKASLDFMLLVNMALGIYMSYDFPLMLYKAAGANVKFSSFDIGGQITLRF